MKKTLIKIDEDLCIGCGACVSDCHGGALQIIDGKARLTNENFCDGLGACIGSCPVGALTLEEREIEPSNKSKNEEKEHSVATHHHHACPSAKEMSFNRPEEFHDPINFSHLRQWPIQLQLLNPEASFLKDANLVLAADCTAFAFGDFHNRFMKNSVIAIACPKLDKVQEMYVEKLTVMIDNSLINTLTVIVMEVPCCKGLLHLALQAQSNAKRKIPVKKVVIGINGDILNEEWV